MKHLKLLTCSMLAIILMPLTALADYKWSYTGKNGPEHWGHLSDDYAACLHGDMQSPIDLQATTPGEIDVSVDYTTVPLTIVNLGKTIQVNFPAGLHMTSSGKVFNLLQVHFHTPSEHTISGETFPLVAHFVHATDEGVLGVLGVLFEEGEANAELQKIVDAAGDATTEAALVDDVMLDTTQLVPDEIEVYRYMGSLTTPPCTEGVHWHVADEHLEASAKQIRAMTKLMGMNARPLLPQNNRLVVSPE